MRASRPHPRTAHRPFRPAALPPLLVLAVLLTASAAAAAGETILPGFDPLLAGTKDPGLLGVERILLRERLVAFGADPSRGEGMPDYDTRMRKLFDDRSGMDFERRLTVIESAGPLGIETVFTYPEYFFLFQSPRTLPGGFVYYPPRDVTSPEVELFVDELGRAMHRRLETANRRTLRADLDIYGRGRDGTRETGLINLTIPIKLPRTLEKIIGRGEKTSIRISGSERISIAGESTVSNRFTPNERRQSQSLFPTLDMEQSLRINLSGQIGEKILLAVDHNSEAIGPEATQIHLSYQGSEDEIIQSIQTGDVGLTLPNSRLLGYSSNKSGLFGLKVEGQLGPAAFTVVASKQKAESSSKDFNSQGGSVTEHPIEAWRYLNNRFFRLDLPPGDYPAHARPDVPGRVRSTQKIDLGSVQVFQFVTGRQQDGDVRNIVAVPDTTGVWDEAAIAAVLAEPPASVTPGELWRPVDAEVLYDQNENLVAIDLLHEFDASDVLAVVYDVVNADGTRWTVGERPNVDDATYEIQGEMYYKMKLLKPKIAEPFTWQYVLRNIYPLGGTNIDASTFEFWLEMNIQSNYPQYDQTPDGSYNSGLQWFRIFGLDTQTQQSDPGHDDIVDTHNQYLFDFAKGILKFPLDFPEPFNAAPAVYAALADTSSFDFESSPLSDNLIPEIYDWRTNQNQLGNYNQFRFVAKHAAASSSFNLGQMNIEEGSESVTLDGRTLVRDQDYTIDYVFGEIQLKGEAAAGITSDSAIRVSYQFAPFLGGGNSSLLGFNVGLELGRESRLSTTWLYESNQVVGYKAKLGEEPSRTLVGNLNGAFTFRPGFLTDVANLISRRDTDRDSELKVTGEVAVSMPNPNTFNEVFVEDFEGIDSSDLMPVNRISWNDASAPAHGNGLQAPVPDELAYMVGRSYSPANRLETRWFLPRVTTQRRHLNPELREQEARETQQVLEIHMRTNGTEWTPENWGGVMRGLGRNGIDLTKTQFLEFWVNDYTHEVLGRQQHGTLHFDFGYVSEDFYWPEVGGVMQVGTYQREDGILGDLPDGVWEYTEDVGLGYDPETGASANDEFDAAYGSSSNPYPRINGTSANNREDTEDLDGDSVHDLQNGFYSIAVSLTDSALVDVLRDYPAAEVQDNIDNAMAWRKYRLRLSDAIAVIPPGGTTPQLTNVTHMRIWYEDDAPPAEQVVRNIQFAEIKFLGSRWEREGVRKVPTADAPEEYLLTPAELPAGDAFFIGEVNNKENPDYAADPPPFPLHVQNQVEEKETSLVLDYQHLAQEHMVRITRLISPRGEDFTQYKRLRWYVYNPDPDQADMEVFYRVGADSLNYYEINYRFDQSTGIRMGWRTITLDMGALSNVKLATPDPVTGWSTDWVRDAEEEREYRVRVVGAPDLRRVKRFYLGVRNTDRSQPASGYFYFNDVRLREVKRETGLAEQVLLGLNMADVLSVNFDWSRRDANFHGLDASVGQGLTSESWSLSGSLRVDDFVPLLGFRMPVSAGRNQDVRRPKYVTNSDIEILDESLRDRESSRDERENFSVRLNRTPSSNAVLRYLLDPWSVARAESRSNSDSPLMRQDGSNSTTTVSFDLRISGNRRLGDLPLLGMVPVVKAVGPLPSKISFGGNFSNSTTHTANWNAVDRAFVYRPEQITRTGQLNGALSFKPLPIVDLDVTLRSDRDLFRESRLAGLNVGAEKLFDQRIQLRFQPPQRIALPDHWLFSPAVALMRSMRSIKPTLNYNGSFTDDHSLRVAQGDDPPGTRNVQNTGDWTFRMSLPLDQAVNSLFPKQRGLSQAERDARIRQEEQLARRGGADLPPVDEDPRLQNPDLTEEERERIRAEILLDRAEQRDEEERARRGGTVAAVPDTAAADAAGGGRRISIPNPLPPLLDVLRGTQPIQIGYSTQSNSGYGRLRESAPFWYKAGFYTDIDTPDSLYVSHGYGERTNLTLSTTSRINKWTSVDLSYARLRADNTQGGVRTQTLNDDWPDINVKLTGLEKLRLLGGPTDGPFRAISLQTSYKSTVNVAGYTETVYNPRHSRQFSPRLNMTLRNEMSISLNVTSNQDRNEQNGNLTVGDRFNVGLQLRHSFRAERLLSRLGLYKPGAQPMVNMDLNLQFSDNSTKRWQAGQARDSQPSTETGTQRISFEPKFSYNITRNLSGALRLIYARDKIKETDLVTQRFGLGLEATFVF